MNSSYWINKVMNTIYTNGTDEFWVGLSSSLPNEDGTNVSEPTGGAYTRMKISEFTSPVGGVVTVPDTITFPKSTAEWFPADSKAAYWVLFDGSGDDANVLSAGELNEPKTIESDVTISIDGGTLGITLLNYDPDII